MAPSHIDGWQDVMRTILRTNPLVVQNGRGTLDYFQPGGENLSGETVCTGKHQYRPNTDDVDMFGERSAR